MMKILREKSKITLEFVVNVEKKIQSKLLISQLIHLYSVPVVSPPETTGVVLRGGQNGIACIAVGTAEHFSLMTS